MNFSERFNQSKKCCIFNRLLLLREGLWKFHFSFVAPVLPACLPSQQECSDHDPVYAAVPRLPRPPRHLRADEDVQCGVQGEGGHYARRHALHVPGHPDAAWRSGVCPHPPAPNHLHPLNPEFATCGRTFTATDLLPHFKIHEELENKESSLPFCITIAAFLSNKLLVSVMYSSSFFYLIKKLFWSYFHHNPEKKTICNIYLVWHPRGMPCLIKGRFSDFLS